MTRKIDLVVLLLLSFVCLVTVNVLWLFFIVPWVGMYCVIEVFPDQTHLLYSVVYSVFIVFPIVCKGCCFVVQYCLFFLVFLV